MTVIIMNKSKPKIIVILGPTSSGKTSLGVDLAYKFNGEIVSADSRQVYIGMDIGTGKDLKEYKVNGKKIPHHLIDVVKPNTKFDLAKYQKLAFKAIDDILKRGKLPILVGGTGLYLQAVIDNYQLSSAKTDSKLRKKLEKLSIEKIFALIKKANPKMAERINNSDRNNKRRLIRYMEILAGDVSFSAKAGNKKYDALIIGLEWPKEILEKRIYMRIIDRLEKEDMMGEVKRLRKQGVSWKRLESFGLEYRFISLHLQEKMEYDEMVKKLFIASRQFAKRQMVWFKRWEKLGARIDWLGKAEKAEMKLKKFLKS
jgi:tRNA dimethylallyltransferase